VEKGLERSHMSAHCDECDDFIDTDEGSGCVAYKGVCACELCIDELEEELAI
jgi:hypothetical protein